MKCIRILLLSAALVSLCFISLEIKADQLANDPDRIVVMISVDGLAGKYMDDPKAEMPNIRSLAQQGVRASAMKPVTPSVTWPNHTTLVTGATPAHHGVIGNNYFDRATRQRVTLIQDPVYDKDEIVKVPTIYDVAKSNGLRTAGMHWPATRNAKTLDWRLPATRSMEHLRRYTTPSLIDECAKAGIPLMDNESEKREPGIAGDELYTKAFNLILKQHRPQLALLHIGNVDHTEHAKGPRSPEAYAAIKAADEQVGEVWKELEADFPGKATLFVVSDHGFSPVKTTILPKVILRQANLSSINSDTDIEVLSQGGAAMVYILSDRDRAAVEKKVRKTFAKVHGVEKVISSKQFPAYGLADPRENPHAPDMILLADEGYTFGDTAAGQLPFEEKPERFGSHGHDASLPDLQATFVAWGGGIKRGAKLGHISNLDVAPTIAKLLHLSLPTADGKPLNRILESAD